MVKVLIADSHFLSREGIKSLISNNRDIRFVGEVFHNADLQGSIKSLRPDVVIIDHNIPGHFELTDIQRIINDFPGIGVIVITSKPERASIISALDYGVSGYLLKECDELEITGAIYSAARNEKFFCGKVLKVVLDQSGETDQSIKSDDDCKPVIFSSRELEVIKLIARGYTTKKIADILFLSFHTIATHRKNIFKKASIRNSSELILYALNQGII